MNRNDVYTFLDLISSRHPKDKGQWVMSSCPLAPFLHRDGTDNNPSFGIKVGGSSLFHCFSCGMKGSLQKLLMLLIGYTSESYEEARNFAFTHDSVIIDEEDREEVVPIVMKEKVYLKIFSEYTKRWRDLTPKDLAYFLVRHDPLRKRMVYPVHNNKGEIIGVRGRTLVEGVEPKYRFYPEYSTCDPKTIGIWLGMRFSLDTRKALFVVEGDYDWMLLKRYGVTNVWASMGSSITRLQLEALTYQSCKTIITFMDNDIAGRRSAETVHRFLGKSVRVLTIDYGDCAAKDPAEAVERGVIKELLSRAVCP